MLARDSTVGLRHPTAFFPSQSDSGIKVERKVERLDLEGRWILVVVDRARNRIPIDEYLARCEQRCGVFKPLVNVLGFLGTCPR
jgi:hypothetical protein